jgi:hypothetical protein
MATVWLTYAWADNQTQDVDYAAQELVAAGLTIKLDRWNIGAGKRLWEQIAKFITDPAESDAWLLYATQNSLGSEPCKEEFAYALQRALETRGETFPVIGLYPATVDQALIPPAIKTRLYVSLADPNWKERVKAAAERRTPQIARATIEPYFIKVHKQGAPFAAFCIEVRPRAGAWSPFFVALPIAEKDSVAPVVFRGGAGHIATGAIGFGGEEVTMNGALWTVWRQEEATPTQSYYVHCKALPSFLMFGQYNAQPQYTVSNLQNLV